MLFSILCSKLLGSILQRVSAAICKFSRKRLNISAIKMAGTASVGTFVSECCLQAPGCQGDRRTSLKLLL